MLLSKIKEIKNDRMIKKTTDSVTPYMVEVGKTLFYHGREGDVVSINGNKVVLDIDGEKYNVYLSECNPGTTGDSKTNKVEIVETNGLWEVRMDGKLVVSATTKEGAIKEAKKFGLMDWNDFKTKDRNIVNINKERRNLEDAYAQALRDGDKGLAKQYSIRLEELRKEAIEAENASEYKG
jgi:hypothetical protein